MISPFLFDNKMWCMWMILIWIGIVTCDLMLVRGSTWKDPVMDWIM